MRSKVQTLGSSNIQGKSWLYLECNWRSCWDLWGDLPLSNVTHSSYNTYEMVGYHICPGIIILGPTQLHHWWGTWFKILVPIYSVTVELCMLWSCYLFADPFPSDVVHTSYHNHKTVGYHIHTGIIILGPLHNWWCTWFKLLVTKTRVTAE